MFLGAICRRDLRPDQLRPRRRPPRSVAPGRGLPRPGRRRGWPIADVYVDDDVSAYREKDRPEYRRMIEDIRAGSIDAVVVWHLDRLHRHPRELEAFFEVCDAAGVTRARLGHRGHRPRDRRRTLPGPYLWAPWPARSPTTRAGGSPASTSRSPRPASDQRRAPARTGTGRIPDARARRGGGHPRGGRPGPRRRQPPLGRRRLNARGITSVRGQDWSIQVLRRMLVSARVCRASARYHDEIVATGDGSRS